MCVRIPSARATRSVMLRQDLHPRIVRRAADAKSRAPIDNRPGESPGKFTECVIAEKAPSARMAWPGHPSDISGPPWEFASSEVDEWIHPGGTDESLPLTRTTRTIE